jgi:hypothetical protein
MEGEGIPRLGGGIWGRGMGCMIKSPAEVYLGYTLRWSSGTTRGPHVVCDRHSNTHRRTSPIGRKNVPPLQSLSKKISLLITTCNICSTIANYCYSCSTYFKVLQSMTDSNYYYSIYLSNRIGSLKGSTDRADSKRLSAAGITTFYHYGIKFYGR